VGDERWREGVVERGGEDRRGYASGFWDGMGWDVEIKMRWGVYFWGLRINDVYMNEWPLLVLLCCRRLGRILDQER
jgi:hypothetical protein